MNLDPNEGILALKSIGYHGSLWGNLKFRDKLHIWNTYGSNEWKVNFMYYSDNLGDTFGFGTNLGP